MDGKLNQTKVSRHHEENAKLDDNQRLANLEHDVVCLTQVCEHLVHQNNRYTDYLDVKIASEKESHEFWLDVRKRIAVAGIWTISSAVFAACLFATKEWLKS